MFSANVRLAMSKSLGERKNVVNRILCDLNLERCADSRVGTHFIRGISGGEKRRVCIGMELVLSPAILFLDEPTSGEFQRILLCSDDEGRDSSSSGLDASTAQNVMSSLHHLSRQGCESLQCLSLEKEKCFFVLQVRSSSPFINLGIRSSSCSIRFFFSLRVTRFISVRRTGSFRTSLPLAFGAKITTIPLTSSWTF